MRLEPVQVKLANTCPLAHAKYTISHSQATSHPMSAHRKLVIVILERKKKKLTGTTWGPPFSPFGHFFVLQFTTARGSPKRSHFLPCPNGGGLVQLLYRCLTPPPQVFEHSVHVVHRVYLPLIALINNKNNSMTTTRVCRMNSLANSLTTSFTHLLTSCNLTNLKIIQLCAEKSVHRHWMRTKL